MPPHGSCRGSTERDGTGQNKALREAVNSSRKSADLIEHLFDLKSKLFRADGLMVRYSLGSFRTRMEHY